MKIKSLLILSLFLFLLPAASIAQIADGYYRVMNLGLKSKGAMTEDLDEIKSDFYTYVSDGTIQTVTTNSTRQTFEALQLKEGLANALYDPQSVVYIKKKGSYYDLEAQGTSVSKITSYNLTLTSTGLANTVKLSTVASGMTVFLTTTTDIVNDHLKAKTVASPASNDFYTYWTVVPVSTTSGNYVGVKPRLTAGGKHYAPYYASYPFKLASAGMKAYYVKNVTDQTYELQEFASGAVIPGGTPVIIECSSTNVADNKLELLYGNYTAVSDNKLQGVYFFNQYLANSPTAKTPFNASTMRVWAVKNDKLVLVNTPEGLPKASNSVACIPANESYLPVGATAAATLTAAAEVPPTPKHTITFDTDGGSAIAAITAEDGSAITAPTNPTKTGYTFKGWSPAVPATMPANNVTVKAQWQINSYTVTFDTDGGSAVSAITKNYGEAITAPAAPTKTGYKFLGWSPALPATMPAQNVTVKAQWQMNSYTVTFDTDGGSAIAPISKNYGEAITAPANPTKTGYTFKGWSPAVPATMPANNVTVKAQWQINSYTVTFDTDGGSAIAAITKNYGETITAPTAPTKNGYTFKGWSPALPATMPAQNVTVKAQWQMNSYTVTFDTDGGSAIAPISKNYGEAITAPANPTKTGYTFKGWDKAIPTTMPAGNVTIKAQWQINSYTVTFDTDGGSAVDAITQDYNTAITAPAAPTKTGYTFKGWSPALPATMPANNVTVKAQWQMNSYTVTFDTDGGSAIAPISKNYGEAITAPANPTKTGYTFKGWDKAIPTTMPAGNVTIKAQWQINSYTVTFDTDGGSAVSAITKNYGEAITAPAAPTKNGYTFKGWSPALPTTMPAQNVTVKAQWQINSYTVTFDTDGGSAIAPISKNYGETITAPANPTKTGYTFKGWDKAIPTTMPANNVTVKAQWQINSYTVTFDTDGGSAVSAIAKNYGEAITAPTAPTKTGYTFKGWDKAIPATMPANNVTIKAQWQINSYTVTFDTDGGSAIAAITKNYGEAITAPAAPTKTGYTFKGWDKAIPATMPANNVTVKAQWQINSYTVTFDTDGGSAVDAITQDYNTAITAPANPTKTGYTFKGWTPAVPETMPANNVTVKAQWQVNSYTVTFDTDGGSAVSAITKNYGEAITAPAAPTKTGYTFKGWDKAIPATMPAGNVTIKAQWQINSYTVTFDTDGGSAVSAITKNYGETITAPVAPTKTGYTFKGWDKAIPAIMPAENVNVKAQWQINSHTVKFISEGVTIKEQTLNYGAAIVPPTETPTKTGADFLGWSPNPATIATMPDNDVEFIATFSTNDYTITFDTDGGTAIDPITAKYATAVTKPADPTKTGYTFKGWSPEVPTTIPAGNITVKAQWQVNSYTVTFDTDGGSAVAAITQDYNTAITVPAAPTKTGYTFAGWTPAVPETMPANNVTVKAQWQINSYTVTFDTDGGSAVAAITQDYNTAITVPAAPTKTGYTFAGWTPAVPETMPANNVTVKAQWQVNSYTVTFDTDGGSAVDAITQDYNTAITAPAAPTKTGYTFAGWSPAVPETMPANNVTVKAQWLINSYTVTFDTDGGSAVDAITQDYNTAITAPAVPTKTGYTFAGWTPAVPETMPANNVTVKAQWTINQYTVTFDTDGGSAVDPITKNYGEAITAPAAPTKTGYTFKGWDKTIPATMPAENVSIKAQWQINSYTVTFDTDGGSAVDAITQDYNTAITAPTAPTKTGYTFAGWTPAVPKMMPAENVSVKAQWTINQYTITFTGIGTENCDPEQFDYNSEVKVVAKPERPNYDFVGWTPKLPAVMPANDITVEAQWKPKREIIEIPLEAGWNWIALSVNKDAQTGGNDVEDGLDSGSYEVSLATAKPVLDINTAFASGKWTSDDLVKNADKYASYSAKYNKWIGTFTASDAINPTAMYKVYSKEKQTLKIAGTAIDPEQTPVTVNPNWNYIGYFNGGADEIYVQEALADYKAEKNDVIKSQKQSAIFDGTKWTGDLETLKRGQGYMLCRNSGAQPVTFKFPVIAATPVVNNAKATVPALFASNMNIIAAVDGIAATEGDEVVAVVNGEVRGAAAVNAEGKALLTVQGEASDAVSFKLQRDGETIAIAKAKVAFAEDAIIGSLDNPTAITFVPQEAGNAIVGDVQAIYNAAGALLPTTDFASLPKGTYIVSSLVDGKTVVTKVTK